MIKVKFFGQLRELVDCQQTFVELPEKKQVSDLLQLLSESTEKFATHLNSDHILVAVNHSLSSMEQQLNHGDEVAFFPPVTGG